MSKITIVRRTYKNNHFTGDNYLSKEEFNKFIVPEKKVIKEIPILKKIKIKRKPTIPYDIYILNKIFKYWLHDNINELENTFDIIFAIHKKNTGKFIINKNQLFKEYARMVFKSNQKDLCKYYELKV